jgi:hypothetical protein
MQPGNALKARLSLLTPPMVECKAMLLLRLVGSACFLPLNDEPLGWCWHTPP